MKAFEEEFEEYSEKNVEETKFWRPLSDRQFAKHFYLAATERAARIVEGFEGNINYQSDRKRITKDIAQKIRGE